MLGITTVAGNQTIERVTKNAFFVAKMAGMGDVPIARGSARPLLRPQVQVCSEIHGETGLGVPVAEPERDPDPRPAAQFIVDVVMREPEKSVTLVATGPLTNVALAARLEPKIVERVKQVVLMGGACHTGNVGPAMEFNIENDPEAAHIVFNEPWQVVMVGLDLTYQRALISLCAMLSKRLVPRQATLCTKRSRPLPKTTRHGAALMLRRFMILARWLTSLIRRLWKWFLSRSMLKRKAR